MTPATGTDPFDTKDDSTRKERREQARAERKQLEASAAQAARRTRLIQLGGIVGVAAVIVVVILVATSGGKKAGLVAGGSTNPEAAAVAALVGGIPESGNVLGNPSAPVTMQYFGDLECPICKAFTLGVLPTVISKYVRTGKLKIEYRSMQTATGEQETFRVQQIAALAAGKQDRAWYYIELFYHEQGEEKSGYVTEAYLQGLASQVPGLNLPNWTAARGEQGYSEQVKRDAQTAAQEGFTGTPSFLLGKSGTTLQPFKAESTTEPASYEAAINKLLA
jgi:protein-disulfide isomerase